MYCILGLGPRSLTGMPPKKKAVESRAEPSVGEAMELVVATEGDAADLESHSRSPDVRAHTFDISVSHRATLLRICLGNDP